MAMIKFLIGIALILVGITVWNSNWFHREVFSKEYWSKQVALLEESIVMDQSMIRGAAIELKKLQLTANLEVAQEINTAKSLGFSTEDARRDAVEMIKMEVKDLRDDMEIWKYGKKCCKKIERSLKKREFVYRKFNKFSVLV